MFYCSYFLWEVTKRESGCPLSVLVATGNQQTIQKMRFMRSRKLPTNCKTHSTQSHFQKNGITLHIS